MNYEDCRDQLSALVEYYSQNKGTKNEATTRLHLIDRLFFNCLGWIEITASQRNPRMDNIQIILSLQHIEF